MSLRQGKTMDKEAIFDGLALPSHQKF